jgi:hypothetical protein
LWTGNFDDPTAGHPIQQQFAFDFVPVGSNGQGQAGKKILAARPGKVVVAVSSEVLSSWKVSTIFVFKAGQYLKFDLSVDPATSQIKGVLPGYPRSLQAAQSDFKNWPPNWTSVDAAVNWGNGKVYFFRGSQYIRWDIAANQMDSNYPMSLDAAHWPGWPPAWNSGIDAAINWGNNKVYFFRKGQYLRYDIPPIRSIPTIRARSMRHIGPAGRRRGTPASTPPSTGPTAKPIFSRVTNICATSCRLRPTRRDRRRWMARRSRKGGPHRGILASTPRSSGAAVIWASETTLSSSTATVPSVFTGIWRRMEFG